jgi:hypothetical protein
VKRKKIICGVLLSVTLAFGGISVGYSANTITVQAEGLGDNLESNTVEDETGVIDFFKNHQSMTSDQLNKASETISPITNIFGYLMGGIIALTSSAIFLITALDLLYISVPPIRGLLYSGGSSQSMGMGGYGMRGGMQQSSGKTSQWVSDEAVQCSALLGGSGGSTQSMGMGGYGMQGGMQQQQSGGTKSVILTYLKKRIFFIILFAVCTVILTSSILLGTGVNLAQWGMKLIEILNNSIPTL